MSTPTPTRATPSRFDRLQLYSTAALAAVGIGFTVWWVVVRLIEVLPGRNVPVLVPFLNETAPLPIGPDGSAVTVEVDRAIVTVPEPAAATLFALIAEPLVTGTTIIAAIVLLGMFCVRLARGHAFTRGTIRLVTSGWVVLLAGWALGWLFTTMSVNGALSAVSNYSYLGVLFEISWVPVFAIVAIGVVGVALQLGERMQRDTEGLV